MVKQAFRFGRAQHLIGVVHEPQTKAPHRWGVLLWNTGISHRIGPYRGNVSIAETLAQLGLTVFRFDLSRLGDSDDPEESSSVQERNSRDIRDALDFLEMQYKIKDFLLIGICSSAVDAYYYTTADARVRALVMVDGFVYPTKKHELLFLWERLSNPHRWKRFFRRLFRLNRDEQVANDYFEANYPDAHTAGETIAGLLERGVSILVLYTGGFQPYFSYPKQFSEMLGQASFSGPLEIHHWPSVDHLFTMLEDRHQLLLLLRRWASELLERPLLSTKTSVESDQLEEKTPKRRSKVEYFPPGQNPAFVQQGSEQDETGIWTKRVLDLFQSLLHPTVIEASDSFFEFGGTSVLATKAASILSEELGFQISVLTIFESPRAQDLGPKLGALQRQAKLMEPTSFAGPSHESMPSHGSIGDGIAIIGIACRVPGAKNKDEFWQLVCEGKSTIQRFTADELDPSLPEKLTAHPQYVSQRGIIDGDRFDYEFFGMNRQEALFLDPQQRILVETCWQALEDAGYSKNRREQKIAVYAGVGANTYLQRNIMQGYAEPHSEEEYLAMIANDKDYVATRIAHTLDLRGPAISVHTACSTSLVAVIEAIKALEMGDARIALAGAASVNSPIAAGQLYQEGGIFSRDGECRPFSADATGTVFSDGSAVLVLKKLPEALADGDQVYAVIRGWGINNDGSEKTSFAAPSIQGQSDAIRTAYQRAGWNSRSVSFMECHGTATPIGDPIEVEALRRAFRVDSEDRGFCAIGSVKAQIGHLTAAAGAIGLIKATLAIYHKEIPPTPNVTRLNPELRLQESPFYIPDSKQPWPTEDQRRAGVSSFGVGGTNAHVLLEQLPRFANTHLSEENLLDPWVLLPWSAADQAACERLRLAIEISLPKEHTQILDYAASFRIRRERLAYVQTAVAWDPVSLADAVKRSPSPLYLGKNSKKQRKRRPLVLVFPGQGSQYPAMGLKLAERWKRFNANYHQVLELFRELCQLNLEEVLRSSEPKTAALINETLYTQPALFSLEWALGRSIIDMGFEVDTMIGHSIGEFVSACLAGVFELQDAVKIVFARAKAMQSAPTGEMLAIRADWDQIKTDMPEDISLAAVNGPQSIVVAGSPDGIATVKVRMQSLGLAARKLETSHAFHSHLMEPVLPEFAKAFSGVILRAPHIKLVSTVTGDFLSEKVICQPEYWVKQLRQAVLFAPAVQSILASEPVFLELGPRDTLTKLIGKLSSQRDLPSSIAVLPYGKQSLTEDQSFAASLGLLWSLGIESTESKQTHVVSTPAYPFFGERMWLDPKTSKAQSLEKTSQKQPAFPVQSPVSPASDLLDRLRLMMGQLAGLRPHDISLDKTWNELGIDSLLLSQWTIKIAKEFSLELNMQSLQHDIPHLQGLMEFILSKRPDLVPVSRLYPNRNISETNEFEPAGSESVSQLIKQQIQVLQQQIDFLTRFTHSDGAAMEHKLGLSEIGRFEFFDDKGHRKIPRYEGSFLAKNSKGEPSVFLPDPEHPGEFLELVES